MSNLIERIMEGERNTAGTGITVFRSVGAGTMLGTFRTYLNPPAPLPVEGYAALIGLVGGAVVESRENSEAFRHLGRVAVGILAARKAEEWLK